VDEAHDEERRVNRIVLYVDDLDRCPPHKVIEVLQAVHLLLAFPLFVVVVGVDARWIARSLKTRYRELLRVDGSEPSAKGDDTFGVARSDDYLEKIFQIPLWLRPLDAPGVRRMMNGLLRPNRAAARTEAVVGGSAQAKTAPAFEPPREVPSPPAPAVMPSGQTAGATGVSSPPVTAEAASQFALHLESLEVRDFEMDMIDTLSPLLGRSPRALKRFVNVYRLIKAGLTSAELAAFLKSDRSAMCAYEAVLLLLAVDTGLPRTSRAVFDFLRRKAEEREEQSGDTQESIDNGIGSMLSALDTIEVNSPDWQKLSAWLGPRQQSPKLANGMPALMAWGPNVSRYSFQAAHAD
jgi:hypothetical protein